METVELLEEILEENQRQRELLEIINSKITEIESDTNGIESELENLNSKVR